MNLLRLLGALTLLFCLSATAALAENPAEDKAGPALPKVLSIGDSISNGYMRNLPELLAGKAEVLHNPGNALHTRNGVAKIDEWLGTEDWAVIHFNFGLHDMKYVDAEGKNSSSEETGHIQVPLAEYKENLRKIVKRLKETDAKLIFATTTPFPPDVEGPLRKVADLEAYNAAAREIMAEEGITLNELDKAAAPHLAEWQEPRNVHFTRAGSLELAKLVAASIEAVLPAE